jgi:hypothetical protein
VRDRQHWNSANIKPRDPVISGPVQPDRPQRHGPGRERAPDPRRPGRPGAAGNRRRRQLTGKGGQIMPARLPSGRPGSRRMKAARFLP